MHDTIERFERDGNHVGLVRLLARRGELKRAGALIREHEIPTLFQHRVNPDTCDLRALAGGYIRDETPISLVQPFPAELSWSREHARRLCLSLIRGDVFEVAERAAVALATQLDTLYTGAERVQTIPHEIVFLSESKREPRPNMRVRLWHYLRGLGLWDQYTWAWRPGRERSVGYYAIRAIFQLVKFWDLPESATRGTSYPRQDSTVITAGCMHAVRSVWIHKVNDSDADRELMRHVWDALTAGWT